MMVVLVMMVMVLLLLLLVVVLLLVLVVMVLLLLVVVVVVMVMVMMVVVGDRGPSPALEAGGFLCRVMTDSEGERGCQGSDEGHGSARCAVMT